MNITITEPTQETQQALGRGFLSWQPPSASSQDQPSSSSSASLSSISQALQSSSSSSAAKKSSSTAQSTLSIEKVEGAAETYPRQKIVYEVTKYNKEKYEMSEEERKKIDKIKWAVKLGEEGNNIIELNDIGEKIILDIKPEWDGKEIKDILVMAYIDNYSETVSQKTKVLEDPYKGTLIRGVVGGDEAFEWQEVKYEVINSNKDGSASEVKEGSDVRWAIKVGKDGSIDREELRDMRWKKIITLKMKPEWANKGMITVMPYLNSPTETVSVKTMVKKIPDITERFISILKQSREEVKNFRSGKDSFAEVAATDKKLYTELTKKLNTLSEGEIKEVLTHENEKELKATPFKFINFYNMVKPYGSWDLKNIEFRGYKNVIISGDYYYVDITGNVLYGFAGAATGFSEEILLKMAGLAQKNEDKKKKGKPDYTLKSYWDDPKDQEQIKAGVYLYTLTCQSKLEFKILLNIAFSRFNTKADW